MTNKLIQQPDILSLDTLGSFMDAQNDPIAPVVEEKVVTKAGETASEVDSEEVVQNVVQEDSSESEVAQVDTTVTCSRKGRGNLDILLRIVSIKHIKLSFRKKQAVTVIASLAH